jgi:hypothetical protein
LLLVGFEAVTHYVYRVVFGNGGMSGASQEPQNGQENYRTTVPFAILDEQIIH